MEDFRLTPILKGPGPFHLPKTQHATAEGDLPNIVSLILCFSDASDSGDASGEQLRAISTPMTPSVARDLAICLWLAADKSESQAAALM
jgi:hypothetical protein